MVGPEQLDHFGEAGILASLDYVLDRLSPQELILSVGETSRDLARAIMEHCKRRGVPVSLWTMVFADRPRSLSSLPYAEDARGKTGYGALGVWGDIGKGDEKFLFHCPSAVRDDEEGIARAIHFAKAVGAQGLFLDRIRYPSPANGLEFLGACSCPRCREAYAIWSGEPWPDLAELAIRCAADGAQGADRFLAEAEGALRFRSSLVTKTVARYAEAAHNANLRVGLDLFAPSLATFVGQDYRALSAHVDFMKPMLYCKAFATSGLPLEFRLLMRGLEQSGVEAAKARDFVSRFSGIDAEALDIVHAGGSFPTSFAASEFRRGLCLIDPSSRYKPEMYAGIELVDHEAYATKIDESVRDSYLKSLSGRSIAVCWNILYVPREHIDAIAVGRKDETVLAMKGISKSFLGVKVLDDVDFSLRKGEVIAFLGANGAGKSTLMKILCGVYKADEGKILLHGEPVSFGKPIHAYRAGISIVHQESSLVPTSTIIENIFLGREYILGPGVLDTKRMVTDYEALCARFDLKIPPATKVRDLSPAHRKMAEIMKAVSRNSSILIMDEPTDALSSQETARLFEIVGDLKRQGMSIVFITHFLDEVKNIADSATVIRDGKIVAENVSPFLPIKEIVALMLGAEALERKPYVRAKPGETGLAVVGLGRRREFSDISFELHGGEVLGIAGVVGSGKTELARTLSGASISHSGTMSIGGVPVRLRSPSDGVRHGIGMAPEDRKTQGLILDHDIQGNISLSSLSVVVRFGCIDSRKERARTIEAASRLSIKYRTLDQKIKFLSGGNQQKCVLARWLLASPRVLILDEPTRGIDVATKEQIYGIVRDLAAKGKSIIYLSGDPAEILVVSDRVMVMQKGKIKRVYDTPPTEDILLKEMIEVNNE